MGLQIKDGDHIAYSFVMNGDHITAVGRKIGRVEHWILQEEVDRRTRRRACGSGLRRRCGLSRGAVRENGQRQCADDGAKTEWFHDFLSPGPAPAAHLPSQAKQLLRVGIKPSGEFLMRAEQFSGQGAAQQGGRFANAEYGGEGAEAGSGLLAEANLIKRLEPFAERLEAVLLADSI